MNKRKLDNIVQASAVTAGALLCILIKWPLSPETLNEPDHWGFKLINGLIGLAISTLLSGFLLSALHRRWNDFIRSCIVLEGLLFCVLLSWPFSREAFDSPLMRNFLNGFVGLAGFTIIGLLLRLVPPLALKRICVPLILGAPLVWAFVTFFPFGPKTYQSPTAVFEAAQAASAKRDMEGVMNCLTEESQETFVEMLVGFFGMMKGFVGLAGEELPEPIAKLDKVMKKHGLSDKVLEEMEGESYPVKDKAALVGDFFKAMKASKTEELPPMWSSLIQPSGKLEGISIDGDTATATAVDGGTRVMIGFIKVGESWLINHGSSGEPAYPASWPDLSTSSDEWKTNPLSEEELERLEGILASIDRLDGFDEESKKLLAQVADMLDEAFTIEGSVFSSPLLLNGEAYTGFTRLGTQFRRWKNGKGVFSATYRSDSQEGYKMSQGWDNLQETDHIRRGTTMSWNEGGQLIGQSLFKDGKQHGLSFMSYPNGQRRSEGLYVEGKRQGPHTHWLQNGQKRSVYMYENGVRNGPYTNWHENGQLSSQSAYKDGKRHGEYKRWHSNGQQWAIRMHENGETVSEKYWNSEGEEEANDSRK